MNDFSQNTNPPSRHTNKHTRHAELVSGSYRLARQNQTVNIDKMLKHAPLRYGYKLARLGFVLACSFCKVQHDAGVESRSQ